MKSSAFDANIVFETIQENAMAHCLKRSAEVKQHQQRACIVVHGKEEVVYHSGHSSFSGV